MIPGAAFWKSRRRGRERGEGGGGGGGVALLRAKTLPYL